MFLGRLYMASAEDKYIQAGRQYLDFMETCADDRYCFGKSCKVGWGAAVVYAATREHKYATVAQAVADYLVDQQDNSGAWVPDEDQWTEAMLNDVTSEHCCILGEVMEALTESN